MKIFLGQTNLNGNLNGHFEILADPTITTKKQAFKYWDQFFAPFNIIELDIPSSIGNEDYADFDKIKPLYDQMKEHFNDNT
jgi:hypothetical protein